MKYWLNRRSTVSICLCIKFFFIFAAYFVHLLLNGTRGKILKMGKSHYIGNCVIWSCEVNIVSRIAIEV